VHTNGKWSRDRKIGEDKHDGDNNIRLHFGLLLLAGSVEYWKRSRVAGAFIFQTSSDMLQLTAAQNSTQCLITRHGSNCAYQHATARNKIAWDVQSLTLLAINIVHQYYNTSLDQARVGTSLVSTHSLTEVPNCERSEGRAQRSALRCDELLPLSMELGTVRRYHWTSGSGP
jgi:hypothetical protein